MDGSDEVPDEEEGSVRAVDLVLKRLKVPGETGASNVVRIRREIGTQR